MEKVPEKLNFLTIEKFMIIKRKLLFLATVKAIYKQIKNCNFKERHQFLFNYQKTDMFVMRKKHILNKRKIVIFDNR